MRVPRSDNRLDQAIALAERNHRTLAVMFLDFDQFKRINDEHGHQAGDRVLIAIAEAAKNEIRENDCFARLGGEEFGLLIEGISRQRAVTIVERIRTAVTRMELGFGHITLSAGLIIGESNMAASVALARADAVMYEAKRLGRDQLVCESA